MKHEMWVSMVSALANTAFFSYSMIEYKSVVSNTALPCSSVAKFWEL